MLKIYKDQSKTTPIKSILGFLVGDGTTYQFISNGAPAEVRKFSSSAVYGELLSEGTDYTLSDNGDGTYTVSLASPPNTGETAVAFDNGEPIFNDLYVIGNSSNPNDRKMEQVLWVAAEGSNAQNVIVAIKDFVGGAGAEQSWHYLAPDSDGSGNAPGTYGSAGASLTIGDMNDGDVIPFWVKVEVPEGTPMENYRDVYLEIQSLQFSSH